MIRPQVDQAKRDLVKQVQVEQELTAKLCLASLAHFTRTFWHLIEPGQPYIHGWHIDSACRHLEAAARFELLELLINWPPRHMKLLSDDTPVPTPNGFTTHGELRVGDDVYHPSGKPIRVIGVAPKDVADFKITFTNGDEIKCNGEHLWNVYDRGAETWKVLKTLQMFGVEKTGRRSRFQLPDVSALENYEKDLPLDPYFVGAWLGDGSSSKCAITVSLNDKNIIEKISANGLWISAECNHPTSDAITYYFSHQRVMQSLRELEMLNQKHIPQIYLNGSISQRLELLAGLIDTDGHVGRNGRVRICNSDKRLIDDIFELAGGLGFRPYIIESTTPDFGEYRGGRPHYQVGFNPTMAIPTALDRKKIGVFDFQRRRIGIVSIVRIPPESGNCIQVDSPDGLYVVGKKLIPTHNSILVNVMFPAWMWAHEEWASRRFMCASYSERNSVRDGVKMRTIIESPFYQRLFKPTWTLRSDQNQKLKFENTKAGFRFSTSVGGAVTGEGGDFCFIAGTKVLTQYGERDIEELQIGDLVWSVDLETQTPSLRGVTALSSRDVTDLVQVAFASGRKVICTPEHLFWVPGYGYKAAKFLKKGDALYAARPVQSPPHGLRFKMRTVWENLRAASVRLSESYSKAKIQISVLFQSVFQNASKYCISPQVCCVPSKDGIKESQVLRSVPNSPFQKPKKEARIFKGFSCDSLFDYASRRFQMLRMRRDQNLGGSPHGRGYFKQSGRKSSDALQVLSCESSSSDSVIGVERYEIPDCGFKRVYDIEVAGNHNFFAEGALVHNCIVDDPVNAMDANSETVRVDANEWWDIAWSTRANNPDAHCKIIIMQRLHENDLTGHVKSKARRPPANRRAHLVFQAKFETESKVKSESPFPILDPRTQDGELLWPERFNADSIAQLAADLDSTGLGQSHAQLQQDPRPRSGGLFKRAWWKRYQKAPSNVFEVATFVDCAQKPGITNDYSVFATWARCAEGYYLLDLWREKVEAPTLEAMAVQKYILLRPDALVIEDKSAGSSLIQYLVRLPEPIIPVLPFDPGQKDKEVRATAATPTVMAGKCYLPDRKIIGQDEAGNEIDLIEEFISEHERFPKSSYDDMVDTTSMMINYFSKRIPIQPRIRSL